MTEVSFNAEWQDGEQIQGSELSATFAALRIDVRGEPLTKVLDDRAQTIRERVFVPLYPIAEWLVSNWWFLSYESENRIKKPTPAFRGRHSLRASTDGYSLPDLTITASGTRTNLQWVAGSTAWSKTEFLTSGNASVDRRHFMQDCADFIDTVIRRLVASDIHSTFLQNEWDAIQNADNDESRFCKLSAQLGWDPYDLDESEQDELFSLVDQLGNLSDEALPVIDTAAPLQDCSAILEAIDAAKPNALNLPESLSNRPAFFALMEDTGNFIGKPWEAGYELARYTRSWLELNGEPISDNRALASVLNQDFDALEDTTAPVEPLRRLDLVEGVVTSGLSGGVSFGLTEKRGDVGRRFLFCRALAEAMSFREDVLITRGNTERQQRNRAFAAEFLAPSSALENRISHAFLDSEQVDNLAEEFGVSTQVIKHQVENHKIAEFA